MTILTKEHAPAARVTARAAGQVHAAAWILVLAAAYADRPVPPYQ
ncbi:hypothetical protein [Streptomyces sp. NPDC087300]